MARIAKLKSEKVYYCPKCGFKKRPCRYVPVLSCNVCKVEMVPGKRYYMTNSRWFRLCTGDLMEINYCPSCGRIEKDPFYFFCTDCKVNYKQGVCNYSKYEFVQMQEIKEKYLLSDPLYDEEAYNKHFDYAKKQHDRYLEIMAERKAAREKDFKCPQCGSTEIYAAPIHVLYMDSHLRDYKTNPYWIHGNPTICHNCGNKWGRGPFAASLKKR